MHTHTHVNHAALSAGSGGVEEVWRVPRALEGRTDALLGGEVAALLVPPHHACDNS